MKNLGDLGDLIFFFYLNTEFKEEWEILVH